MKTKKDNKSTLNFLSDKPRTPRKPIERKIETYDPRQHSFNIDIAKDFGINTSLWLCHLAFWSEKNLANNKHIHDGLVWCYDTLDALCDYFPYFTRRQIEVMIKNSVEHGLVQKGNYNHTTYDRTVWYALTKKAYFYFQHLLNEKYLNRMFLSISQKCEMDFTEWGNGFHRNVTTIPDTDPDTDPMCVGKNPSHTNIKKFPTAKDRNRTAAEESSELRTFFEKKFSGRDISYETLFQACIAHYDQKSQWVTVEKWKSWIERENIENHPKIGSVTKKTPINETDEERRNRQFMENEQIKENENKGYASPFLTKERIRQRDDAGYVSKWAHCL